jgi:ADP-heptose:LPS heptosyltransferase
MAAALGLRTIAIFGPSDHKIWSPRGEKVFVVRKEMNCSPCSEEKFVQCKNLECLREVEAVDVVEGIRKLKIQL